eukprot:gi/632947319/ref/XP_007888989.1/ PREDICTED: ankyrin repeat and SOCS box protein 4 isoform X2 [Callorhinchus milii]
MNPTSYSSTASISNCGYWLPGYKMGTSWATALHLSVMLGHLEIISVLLDHKAAINYQPNGKAPLHIACDLRNVDCLSVLIHRGANVNIFSMSGLTPLHFCTNRDSVSCAKRLVWNGAKVNLHSKDDFEATPLHVAARFGIPELVELYIKQGAAVDSLNIYLETPLITAIYWALNMKDQVYSTDHHLVCRMLLDHGACVNARDEDYKSPLHKAAWNSDDLLIQMLLEAGGEVQRMDVNGCAPLQYLLKVTPVRPAARPEICYQLLLNHGAARIFPPHFHKVLQSCCSYPKAVEVMVNSYEYIESNSKWRKAIPDDVLEQHWDFYESLFDVCGRSPRSLLHLTRCAIRAILKKRCYNAVPKLCLPRRLKQYILLEAVGQIY